MVQSTFSPPTASRSTNSTPAPCSPAWARRKSATNMCCWLPAAWKNPTAIGRATWMPGWWSRPASNSSPAQQNNYLLSCATRPIEAARLFIFASNTAGCARNCGPLLASALSRANSMNVTEQNMLAWCRTLLGAAPAPTKHWAIIWRRFRGWNRLHRAARHGGFSARRCRCQAGRKNWRRGPAVAIDGRYAQIRHRARLEANRLRPHWPQAGRIAQQSGGAARRVAGQIGAAGERLVGRCV